MHEIRVNNNISKLITIYSTGKGYKKTIRKNGAVQVERIIKYSRYADDIADLGNYEVRDTKRIGYIFFKKVEVSIDTWSPKHSDSVGLQSTKTDFCETTEIT